MNYTMTETVVLIVLAIFQLLTAGVVLSGVPWAFGISRQLASLQTLVNVYEQQHRKMGSDLVRVVHRIDTCQMCNGVVPAAESEA